MWGLSRGRFPIEPGTAQPVAAMTNRLYFERLEIISVIVSLSAIAAVFARLIIESREDAGENCVSDLPMRLDSIAISLRVFTVIAIPAFDGAWATSLTRAHRSTVYADAGFFSHALASLFSMAPFRPLGRPLIFFPLYFRKEANI